MATPTDQEIDDIVRTVYAPLLLHQVTADLRQAVSDNLSILLGPKAFADFVTRWATFHRIGSRMPLKRRRKRARRK